MNDNIYFGCSPGGFYQGCKKEGESEKERKGGDRNHLSGGSYLNWCQSFSHRNTTLFGTAFCL